MRPSILTAMSDLLMPGVRVWLYDQWWTVGAVGRTGGERYYWLRDEDGQSVAMLPAFVVEPAAETEPHVEQKP